MLLLFLMTMISASAQEDPKERFKIIIEEFGYGFPHTKYLIKPDSINVYRQSLRGEISFHKALTQEERQLYVDLLLKFDITKLEEEYEGVMVAEKDGVFPLANHDHRYVVRIISGTSFQKSGLLGIG